MLKCLLPFLLAILFSINLQAQQINQGAGYYNLTQPSGSSSPSNLIGAPTSPKVTNNFNQAIQTNDWWSSLIWKYTEDDRFNWEIHSWKLYPHPFALSANRYGLKIYYPKNASVANNNGFPNARYQYNMPSDDFTVGVEGMDLGTTDTVKVDSYGDWHVVGAWDDQLGNTLKATMSHGSPYVYFEKGGNNDVYFRLNFAHSLVHTIGDNIFSITLNGHHYGIFLPTGSTYTLGTYTHDQNQIIGNNPSWFLKMLL